MNVRTTEKADRQILAIATWWRRNRPAAPSLFSIELASAIDTLSRFPRAGSPYPSKAGIRRYALRATRNHIYYVLDDGGVLITAVWGATRGRAPDL